MNSNDQTWVTVPLGRFVTKQPGWLQWEDGRHSVRQVMIQEHPWPEDTDASRAFEQRWDSTMNTLRNRDFNGSADLEQMVVDERNIRPGLRGVLYHRGYHPEELMWHLLLRTDRMGITFQKNSWETDMEADFDVVKNVAESYERTMDETSSDSGFRTRNGMITLPFQEAESLMARYAGNGMELTYEFRTLRQSPEIGLVERIKEGLLKKAARMVNLQMDTIRDRNRTVGSLDGKEEVVIHSKESEQRLTCLWLYPGQEQSGTHPRIEIEMTAPADRCEDALSVWDRILNTLRAYRKTK